MNLKSIAVTDRDFWRLNALVLARAGVSARDEAHLGKLAGELARSIRVDPAEVPDVVTMHARVRVRDLDSGAAQTYTLSFPHESDLTRGRLSVLAPLGTALLGYRQGDEITWEMQGGARRLRLERVWPAGRRAATVPQDRYRLLRRRRPPPEALERPGLPAEKAT